MTRSHHGARELSRLPAYDQLPAGPAGGRLAWDLFGPDSDRGLLALQTPERVSHAAGLVRTGKRFALSPPMDLIDPPMFGRRRYEHALLQTEWDSDDYIDTYYPQSSAHLDSLAHAAYAPGVYYNGVTSAEIATGSHNTINFVASKGIAGRAVLLNLAYSTEFDDERAYTVEDLQAAQRQQGIVILDGDSLLLRTGFMDWYAHQPSTVRQQYSQEPLVRSPGLENTEAMAAYLWDLHICAVAADNPAVERCPMRSEDAGWPIHSLHQILIGGFGMTLGELWWLEELTQDCQEDGVWEMLLVATPMPLRGGIGSPANALAIK